MDLQLSLYIMMLHQEDWALPHENLSYVCYSSVFVTKSAPYPTQPFHFSEAGIMCHLTLVFSQLKNTLILTDTYTKSMVSGYQCAPESPRDLINIQVNKFTCLVNLGGWNLRLFTTSS